MPFTIIRNDITKVEADAIVNSTNEKYIAAGGADLVIHREAGPELKEALRKLPPLQAGEAVVTEGFNLKAKYIIHTSAPVWDSFTESGNRNYNDKNNTGDSFENSVSLFQANKETLMAPTNENSEKLLYKCYKSCLEAAREKGCESVAFPLMSSGTYGCPKETALKIAIDAIRDFLFENDMMVYLVVYDKKAFQISSKLFENVRSYIDDNYVAERNVNYFSPLSKLFGQFSRNNACHLRESEIAEYAEPQESDAETGNITRSEGNTSSASFLYKDENECPIRPKGAAFEKPHAENEDNKYRGFSNAIFHLETSQDETADNKKNLQSSKPIITFEQVDATAASAQHDVCDMPTEKAKICENEKTSSLKQKQVKSSNKFILDESFADMLLRKIDEKGLADADVYKRASVSKQVFSNIKSKPDYIPTNSTVLSFAIALELSLEETEELLMKAGYALSPSRMFDVIVKYFIVNKNYDIFEINATLFQFDQKLLGSK